MAHSTSEDEGAGNTMQLEGKAINATAQAKGSQDSLDVVKKAEKKEVDDEKPDLGTFWGLLILGLAYVHHSTSG